MISRLRKYQYKVILHCNMTTWISDDVLYTPSVVIPLKNVEYKNSIFRVSDKDVLLADILVGLNEIYINTPDMNVQYNLTEDIFSYFSLLSKKHDETNNKNSN
jgi:hypothetical protein